MRPTAKAKRARKEIIMSNTTSSAKSVVRFPINFIDHTISGTKASFNKASKGFGPEYEELSAKIAAHPTFELVIKEQKTKSTKAKKTYDGLDFKFMEDYISTLDNAVALMKKYEAVKQMAKDCDTKVYPLTKKWFLDNFGSKEEGFDMEAAKERISNFRIAQAEKKAAEALALVAAATAAKQTEIAA